MKTLHLILTLVALLLGGYALLCVYVYLNQTQLIFFPPAPRSDVYSQWQEQAFSESINGASLHGWEISRPQHSDRVIIYFGGNGEDVVYNLYDADNYPAGQLFFTNYRGYGNSSGEASQQALYHDALALFDRLLTSRELQNKHIYVMGRSLGSAVATHVASQRKVSGLILVTPFDSMASVASVYYPWLPVQWLLKHRFNTREEINSVEAPVLILAAAEDEIIPRDNLQKLLEAVNDNSRMIMIEQADHQNISQFPDYFSAINKFINAQEATGQFW